MSNLIFKVFVYFKSMLNYIILSNYMFAKNKLYLSSDSKIIVSLTTYSKRVDLIHLTLKSILLQTSPPKKIYLWLSKVNFPNEELPESLQKLVKLGVTIKFVEEDIRSYKKIIYTYEEEQQNEDLFIVTADDDIYYPKYWLKHIEDKIKLNSDYIYCYRAQSISFKTENQVDDYSKWILYNCSTPSYSILPTGVSGICYPMKSLKGVCDLTFLEICPTADDIWLRFITLKNEYKSKLVCGKSLHFTPVIKPFNMPDKGLEKENVFMNANTKAFNNCLSFFNFTKKDF
ncbi:hypothetical protein C9J01_17230 [Photobacterium rosenbergii]|uniref:Glycosyltransferase 2-like domain-containing protein n=1 Tax=Photobacterium rosenbergii TaxID=294936 RepID=A0A2T3NBF8_9GAMM|nr:hypothetical protein [Photobacterium rosenbergii]PSW11198.1 hypothetical protein C9J01_17230 [Photobacterium rosenbergii]